MQILTVPLYIAPQCLASIGPFAQTAARELRPTGACPNEECGSKGPFNLDQEKVNKLSLRRANKQKMERSRTESLEKEGFERKKRKKKERKRKRERLFRKRDRD